MRWQRLAVVLSLANLVLLAFTIAGLRPVAAETGTQVLRGRTLELVDDRGRVRADIKVLPADPNVTMPDKSKGYPESVLLRLIDSQGGANVKLSATEDGAGLVLGGDSAYVQILSRGGSPFVKIVSKDGSERIVDTRPPDATGRK